MKVIEKYIIELSFEEAFALKKWLGKRSDDAGKNAGLGDSENDMLSNLFSLLPDNEV